MEQKEQLPDRNSKKFDFIEDQEEERPEKVRVFSSYFGKEISENDVIKGLNEETFMDIEKDFNGLKSEKNKIKEECELYRKQLEELEKENEVFSKKIADLEQYQEINKDLEILKNEYENELEVYKKDLEIATNQIHYFRSQILENQQFNAQIQIEDLKRKIEIIEKEKKFMIEKTLYFKEEMANNYNFYNEELEKTKKEFIQAKINYSQILMEKEYLSLRLKQFETLFKQQNLEINKK